MKIKIITIILIVMVLVSIIGIKFYINKNQGVKMEEQKYQGPVPEGYDEEHFRKTGETIPLKENT